MKKTITLRALLLLLALALILPMAVACKKEGTPQSSEEATEGTTASSGDSTTKPKPGPFDPPYIEVDPAASVYSGTPDTSWYSEGKTEFTLTSADQLMGFQQLRAQNKSFEGVTIKLGCDMIINAGTAEEIQAKGSSNHAWLDLDVANAFRGTIDGQGHVISGVYMQLTSDAQSSMFGSAAGNATLKNLKLTNSYFGLPNAAADKEIFGVFFTQVVEEGAKVTISKIDMNVTIAESGKTFNKVGGYIGYVDGEVTVSIDNSTFNGSISVSGTHVGGMIGHVAGVWSVIRVTTCTNFAALTTVQYCGGMIGQSKSQDMKVIDCINRGKLNCELNCKTLTGEHVEIYDPYEGAHPAIKEGTSAIRVMSFNVQGSLPKSSGILDNAAQNRVNAVRTEILYYSPDLIGLQEDNWYWLNALNLTDYNMIQDSNNGSSAGSERCAIFYKKGMTLLESGTYWMTVDGTSATAALTYADVTDPNSKFYLTDTDRERLQIYSDADLKRSRKEHWDETTGQWAVSASSFAPITTRKFTYGVFEVNGQILIYVNTHLTHRSQNADYSNDELQKIRSLARIAEWDNLMEKVTKIQAKYQGSLTFFTGDFNDNRGKPIYNYVTKDWGYSSAEAVTPEHIGTQGSWNNAFDLDKQGDTYPSTSNKEGTSKDYLDYCFVQDGLTVERFTVGQGRADILDAATGAPKKIYTSDHLPVITDLSFKTATTGTPIVPDPSKDPAEDLSKPSIYNGFADTSWYTGKETEYTLTNAAQFAGFLMIRQNGGGNITFEGVTIKLARDLIFNQGTVEEFINSEINPIELQALNSNYLFKGTFDGQGHTISGIYLQCTTSGVKGLFGGMGDNAVIKDLTLDQCYAGGPSTASKNTLGILTARIVGKNVLFSNVKITNFIMKEGTVDFYGVGALTGRVDATASLTIENCEVSNGVFQFATYGTRIGSLVGVVQSDAKTSVTVKNTIVKDVEINGKDECGGLIGATLGGTISIDTASSFTGTINCPGKKNDQFNQ